MAWYDVGSVLVEWESLGVFSYVLPFLLIFAVVFAILSKLKIFEDNRAINMIISLAIALLSLQFGFVSNFFAEIFPRMGVGIAILLVALILFGAFINWKSDKTPWIFFGIGAVIFVFILFLTFSSYSWWGSYWFEQYRDLIVVGIVIIAVIVAITVSGKKKAE